MLARLKILFQVLFIHMFHMSIYAAWAPTQVTNDKVSPYKIMVTTLGRAVSGGDIWVHK